MWLPAADDDDDDNDDVRSSQLAEVDVKSIDDFGCGFSSTVCWPLLLASSNGRWSRERMNECGKWVLFLTPPPPPPPAFPPLHPLSVTSGVLDMVTMDTFSRLNDRFGCLRLLTTTDGNMARFLCF